MTYKGRAPFPSAAFVESQRNFTYFDKSLTSGLSDVTIESPGDFLYIDQASTGYVYIELNQRQSGALAPILLAAGGSIECDFASVKLYAPAQLNKSVRIVIGNGARIKGGANVNADSMSISVVDGALTRTIAAGAYFGCASVNAVAAQYSETQLWNPVGSGKNLFLETLSFSSSTAQTIQIGGQNNPYGATSSNLMNKYLSSASGQGQVRGGNNAALAYYILGTAFACAASTPMFVNFKEPILIPPGYGVVVTGTVVNTTLITNYEWYEK